jgi:hypothetical protein
MASTKKALVIGCNYINDPNNQLYGCINDASNIANTLVDAFDYDLNNIVFLRDDFSNNLPTRSNILYHLNKLAQESAKLSEIWFFYSGHGSKIRDTNNDETGDNLDEVIVPTDFLTAGFITDDEIFNVLKTVSSKCRVILLFDCCHSGSICDLQYAYKINGKTSVSTTSVSTNKVLSNPNIICFSGCRDPETSAETYSDIEQRPMGAFTMMFLYCLRLNHFNVDIFKLFADICNTIAEYGYEQNPQLSCSSSKLKFAFTRYTYREISTLSNPTPRLLSAPVVAPTKSVSATLATRATPSMKMAFSFR